MWPLMMYLRKKVIIRVKTTLQRVHIELTRQYSQAWLSHRMTERFQAVWQERSQSPVFILLICFETRMLIFLFSFCYVCDTLNFFCHQSSKSHFDASFYTFFLSQTFADTVMLLSFIDSPPQVTSIILLIYFLAIRDIMFAKILVIVPYFFVDISVTESFCKVHLDDIQDGMQHRLKRIAVCVKDSAKKFGG